MSFIGRPTYALMMVVVTFVRVRHIYTTVTCTTIPAISASSRNLIGHLLDVDAGDGRTTSCSCLRLGSGGCVSYLLIGFWLRGRPPFSPTFKAFLVNRWVTRFVLGIAGVCITPARSNIAPFSNGTEQLANHTMEIIPARIGRRLRCMFVLFVGAMGKSAQMPRMCGCRIRWKVQRRSRIDPCATMVTARYIHGGRMSRCLRFGTALSTRCWSWRHTAFFMGLFGLVK